MTFAQRRNRLTTHFSERIPDVKRRVAVPLTNSTTIHVLTLSRTEESKAVFYHCSTISKRSLLFWKFRPRLQNFVLLVWAASGIGRMIQTGVNRRTGEKPLPVPLYPTQISHALARDRNRSFAVRSRRLTTWTTARPLWDGKWVYTIYV